MRSKLIYVFDPLCGWCYGFSKTIVSVFEEYHQQLEFDVISGGMIIGSRVTTVQEIEEYISNAYETVETTTGVKFGSRYLQGFLRSKTSVLDSEPPSRALEAFKIFEPDHAVRFAHELQQMHYWHGMDYGQKSTYEELISKFGIDWKAFSNAFESQKVRELTQKGFAWTSRIGVKGFPTVLLQSGDELFLLAHGYQPAEQLKSAIDRILDSAGA